MNKRSIGGIVLTCISFLIAIVFLAPIIWTLFVSLQFEGKQIISIWDWFTPPYTFQNYVDVLTKSSVFKWFTNSLFIAVISTVGTVLISAMASYAIAKIPFKGSKMVFFYFMLGIMVPGEATIVPLFITANGLGIIDTYAGLILPGLAGTVNLMIMVTFMRGIPNEILEAVRIDGGGEFTIFTKFILPLSSSVLATVTIFSFMGSWNNYLWPMLCAMDENLFTLPVGIPTFAGTYTVDFVKPMTANMVASIPMIIIYVFFEKRIVQGITTAAVKG